MHSRSAMLEPVLESFAVAMILLFLLLLKWCDDRRRVRVCALLLVACFAGALKPRSPDS